MIGLRAVAREVAYTTGALRLRAPETLTVAMFHRITAPCTPAAARSDPTYAMPAPIFAACLDFFRRHYAVVGLQAVLASLDGGAPLPQRALLVTFDDGWRDNLEIALPLLRAHDMPAALFVPSDVLDIDVSWWWQEILLRSLREHRATYADLWEMAGEGAPEVGSPGGPELALLLRWGGLDPAKRTALLTPFAVGSEEEGPHMIRAADLSGLVAGGIAIGAHGAAHQPMSLLPDAAADLARSRAMLGNVLVASPDTLSFPYGRYDAATVAAARKTGFRVLFTSDACLNAAPGGRPVSLLGRISVEARMVTDAAGCFAPSRLATWLFNRPVRSLADPI